MKYLRFCNFLSRSLKNYKFHRYKNLFLNHFRIRKLISKKFFCLELCIRSHQYLLRSLRMISELLVFEKSWIIKVFLVLLRYYTLVPDHDIIIWYVSSFFLFSSLEIDEHLTQRYEMTRVDRHSVTMIIGEWWYIWYEEWDMMTPSELDPRSTTIVCTYIEPATRVDIEWLDTSTLEGSCDADSSSESEWVYLDSDISGFTSWLFSDE
jgi:hypothetical protein